MRVWLTSLVVLSFGCTLGPRPGTPPPERSANVFPLFFHERSGQSVNTVVFPLYFHHRDDGGVYTALFPVIRYKRLGENTEWQFIGGLAAYRHEPEKGFRRVNIPFIGWERRPGERGFYIFPLMSIRSCRGAPDKEDLSEVSVLGPFYMHFKRKDYYSLNMFFWLFNTTSGVEKDVNVYRLRFLPAFSYSKKWEPSGLSEGNMRFERKFNLAGPLLTIHEDNYGRGYRRVDFLWPFIRFTRGFPRSPREREVTFYALPVLGWYKHWTYDISDNVEQYTNEFRFVDPLFVYRKDTTEGVQVRILGGLVMYRRLLTGDRDFRILARTVHIGNEGTKRVCNVWPLFGTEWDRTANTRKTIVLAGLFYYRRDADGGTTKRILWFIPIGRRRPQELPKNEPVVADSETGQ